jgi:glycosyltransferase involved in cell wall biosynthesis
MNGAARGLWIVDPSVRDELGHYAAYARAVAEAGRAAGASVRVFAHRNLSPRLAATLGAEPTFRYDFWHRFVALPKLGALVDPPVANFVMWRELRRALGGGPGADGVVFAPTIDHRQLLAWAAWMAGLPPAERPTLCLLLRYTFVDVGAARRVASAAAWARLGFATLKRVVGGRVRLLTDSARLAAEYASLTTLPVEVVPIPHIGDIAGSSVPLTQPGLRADRPIRFVSLGDARTEKGFALLADAIRWLDAAGKLTGLEFVIQSHIASPVYAALATPRAELSRIGAPAVRLVDKVLSREEYAELLGGADVVLLPYTRRVYFARTSGPFTEALAAGKPVIVTADTWMSEELERHGAGLTFRDGDAADLAGTILRAKEGLAELSQAARARRGAWLRRHSPAAMVLALLGRS